MEQGGQAVPLQFLTDQAPGTVHAVHPGIWDCTYIAADGGIFATDPSLRNVDIVMKSERFGSEPPRDVVQDPRGRLWVVTSSALYVVTTSHRHVYRPLASSAAGKGAFSSVELQPSGEIRIRAADGTVSYTPDSAPPPKVPALTANGRPFNPGDVIEVVYPARLRVEFEPMTEDGATVRAVSDIRGRIKMRAKGTGVFVCARADPGLRRVRFYAIDRDGNPSAGITIPVLVKWPTPLQPSRIRLFVLIAVVVGFGAPFGIARKRGIRGARLQRVMLGTLLVMLLGGQLLAAAIPHGRTWPFVGWTMYTNTAEEGAVVEQAMIELLYADGSVAPLKQLRYYPVSLIYALRWNREEAGEQLLRDWNETADRPVVGVRVRAPHYRLTAEGPQASYTCVLAEYYQEQTRGVG